MSAGIPVLPGRDLPPQPDGPGWPAYWRQDAACGDEDLAAFFPPDERDTKARKAAERAARRICSGCPVRRPCLATAIAQDERHGVWGGLTSGERATLVPRGRIAPDDVLAVTDRVLAEARAVRGW